MKFAHLADCHLGGWREPKLREANTQSFVHAIDYCIKEKVDFVLIAGDLFNTSLPSMEALKVGVEKLKDLKDAKIPVYVIAGSHDFSPSGKTMIDVLESAGLFKNVTRAEEIDGKLKLQFTRDPKTDTKITGLLGKKGGLEKEYYYELLTEHLEAEPGYKIFMFHSPINELKPADLAGMEAMGISMLPKGFSYYAGGHVHVVQHQSLPGYQHIVYPGPTFPNNFAELEKLKCGSFVIVEDNTPQHLKIELRPTHSISVDVNNKTPAQAQELIEQQTRAVPAENAIITIRVAGTLEGKVSDIDFKKIFDDLYARTAYCVLKNTNKLTSNAFQEIKVSQSSVEDIEDAMIAEHAGQLKALSPEKEKQVIKDLLRAFDGEKDEGEKIADFEKRIKAHVDQILGME